MKITIDKRKKLLSKAVEASINAGKEILKVYYSDNFDVEIKKDKTPLTLADKAAHNEIIDILEKTNIPILSEEGKSIDYNERKKWEYFWLVDPLDGTKEFIKKNDEFTVNIALIYNGNPISGIIYVPVLKLLYVGDVEIGSYLINSIDTYSNIDNLIKIGQKLPKATKPNLFTIVGSRSHMNKETEDFMAVFKEKYGYVDIISKGSSLKLCMVAEGLANIYPRFAPTMEWDTAAGHAIALGANCTVTQQDQKTPLTYNKENLLNPWFIVKQKDVDI
jgi:3'(2'), 5'-bisphosphate nucleotidase